MTTSAPRNPPLIQAPALLLALLALSYSVSYYDRMIMMVVGETVKREFLLSDKQLSLLTGAAFVALYGVASVASGWLVDRYNRKRVLVWSIGIFSVLTAACGLAHSFPQLALARAGVGVSEAAGAPVAMSLISNCYPPHKRPFAVATFYGGGMVGTLIAFMVGGWIATRYGWRAAFLIAAPVGFVLALLIAATVQEPERERGSAPVAGEGYFTAFDLIWQNHALRWLVLSAAIGSFMSTGMMSWLPMFFIRSHHLEQTQLGLLFGPVLGIGAIIGLLAGGWVGNRLASRSVAGPIRFCTLVMLGVIPLYVLLLSVPSLPVALALTLLTTAVSALLGPCFVSTAQTLCDPRARGTVHGVMNLTSSLAGGALLPFAAGALSDYWAPQYGQSSLRYALIASNIFCLVGAASFAYTARLIGARRRTQK